jgi:hypothetical protein
LYIICFDLTLQQAENELAGQISPVPLQRHSTAQRMTFCFLGDPDL